MSKRGAALREARATGVLISISAYLLAMVVAVFTVRAVGFSHPLADLALGTLAATVVVFAVSAAVDNSSIYDPYWSVQPLAIAGYFLWTQWGHIEVRQWVVTGLVLLYAVRLTSNFYRDWPGLSKEDFRYVEFRESAGKAYWPVSFLGIHLFPTILVYLGCLPLYAVAQTGGSPFGWLDGVGAALTLTAVVIAFVADEQLRRFRAKPSNRGKVADVGLWGVSRHPNYLGEITTWWGLWLMALGAGREWWWTVAGAVAITVMFVFVSVPWMERRMLATRPGYADYRSATSMLLPLPGR